MILSQSKLHVSSDALKGIVCWGSAPDPARDLKMSPPVINVQGDFVLAYCFWSDAGGTPTFNSLPGGPMKT